jgi:excisionase family DNA binding protein
VCRERPAGKHALIVCEGGDMDVNKLAYTIPEACIAAGLGRTMLYQLLTSGEIESFTVGSRRLIPRSALEAFIARRLAAQGGARSNGQGNRPRSRRGDAAIPA